MSLALSARLTAPWDLSEGTCIDGCTEEIKKNAYYSLIRPHLEYASNIWDPRTQKQVNDIERVQRRAATVALPRTAREEIQAYHVL